MYIYIYIYIHNIYNNNNNNNSSLYSPLSQAVDSIYSVGQRCS